MAKLLYEQGDEGKDIGPLGWQKVIGEIRDKIAKELSEFEGNLNDEGVKIHFAQMRSNITVLLDQYKKKFGDNYPKIPEDENLGHTG